jgi:outer membrane protein OmpA-like peptidoglycan-associated protein
MMRSLFYIAALAGVAGLAYYLPKVVQQSDGFAPLAESMVKDVTPQAPPVVDPPAYDPTVEGLPDAVVDPSVVPAPTVAPAPVEPDLTPLMTAMAAGDYAKAAALLDIMKPLIAQEKFKGLTASVEAARKREADTAALAAAEAKKATEAAKPVAAPAVNTDAVVLESLRQLQQTQKETAQMLAALSSQKAAPAAPPAPTAAAAPAAASSATAVPSSSTPLSGLVAIQFPLNSSFVSDAEGAKLSAVLQTLKAEPDTHVELRGYADKSGSSDYNLGLSTSRATSVKDIFRKAGISDKRISMLPMGSFQAGDATGDKAAAMRRVEVLLVR